MSSRRVIFNLGDGVSRISNTIVQLGSNVLPPWFYEHFVRPMHQKFVQPSSAHSTWVWRQLQDRSFPQKLIENLRKRLDGR